MKQTLRDYSLVSLESDRDAGVYPTIASSGDFFMIRAVFYESAGWGTAGQIPCFDIPVRLEFDGDQGSITRRAGEGGRRNYDRLRVVPLPASSPSPTGDIRKIVTAGFGELFSEREEEVIPQIMQTTILTVPANDEYQAIIAGARHIKEIRMNIPMTESGGLSFSGISSNPDGGAWLEKGVTEWIKYSGSLYFINDTANDISVNLCFLYRNDF